MTPFTDVYFAQLPSVLGRRGMFPPERETYILQTGNPVLQRQRYYVWLLLEYALFHSLEKHLPELQLYVENGKWTSPVCHFSLSHGDNGLAVAVSNAPVGVDIQKCISKDKAPSFILSPNEVPLFENATDKTSFLTELWTKKESIFKASNEKRFLPCNVDTTNATAETRWVELAGERYAVSASSPIRHFEQVQL
jgi:hypothetical protein